MQEKLPQVDCYPCRADFYRSSLGGRLRMLAWRCVVRTNLSAEMRSCQHCVDLQSTGANVTLSAACLVLLAVSAGASSS